MKRLLAIMLLTSSWSSYGGIGPNAVTGTVYDITSVSTGLLIRVKDELATNIVPTNCQNPSASGWMLIPEQNKTLISTVLVMRAQKQTYASVYTSPTANGTCNVIQYDPHDNN